MSIRILLLTQWFDPEPTPKGLAYARELVRQGFEVEVVTGFPNYPGGKIYPGYKFKLLQREHIDGVRITRVPLYPSHDRSIVRRIFNYVSFSITSLIYTLFCTVRPQVIYAYHPPLTVGLVAICVGFCRRVPVVYDIQDMWPDTLRATGMISSTPILRSISKICDVVYKNAAHLTVLSPGFKRLLVQRGVPEKKIDIIYNWCDENALLNSISRQITGFPDPDKFRILFAGNMGKAQGLGAVLDAAELLHKIEPEIVFILMGEGVEAANLKKSVNNRSLDNVIFLPSVPMAEISGYLNAADALLVHLKMDPLFEITIPSKTQAYLAVGKPILMAVKGDAANLIMENNCGLTAEPEDPRSIADAAIALMKATTTEKNRMAENGRSLYHRELSLSIGGGRFGDIFRQVVAVNRRDGV